MERFTLPAVFCLPENKTGLDKPFSVRQTGTGQKKNSLEIVVVQLLCFFANAQYKLRAYDLIANFFSLFSWSISSTPESFTYLETSPLPVKDNEFLPILGSHSEGFLTCHTYCDTDQPFYNGNIRGPVTLIPVVERLGVQLSLRRRGGLMAEFSH